MQTVIRFAEYCRLKKLNTSYFRFLFDFGSTWRVLRVPVVKLQKGCLVLAVALSTCSKLPVQSLAHNVAFLRNRRESAFYAAMYIKKMFFISEILRKVYDLFRKM